jgi:hypothetical protein
MGIVPSLLEFESKERSLPKEEPMPGLSVLQKLFYHLLLRAFPNVTTQVP